MDIKTNKDFQEAADRIELSREDYRKIASQIVEMFCEKGLLTCEAKIILGLCDDIVNVNSSIRPTRNNCDCIPRSSDGPCSGPIVSFSNC